MRPLSLLRGATLLAGMAMTAVPPGAAFAQEPPAAVATIEATASEGGVRLAGRALALSPGDFDARMTIEKTGRSGRTSTTQGGAFSLKRGESAVVATVGLSMAPGDRLAVDLVLTAAGQEVGRSLISVGP